MLVARVCQRRESSILDTNLLAELEGSIEDHTLRQLKRFLSYEKDVKSGKLSNDFAIRLSKTVFTMQDERLYSLMERGNALELVFCELMIGQWEILEAERPNDVFYPKLPSRLKLYLKITDSKRPKRERAAHLLVLKEMYKKHASWFREISAIRVSGEFNGSDDNYKGTLNQVMDLIRDAHPEFVDVEETVGIAVLNRLRAEHEKVLKQFEADLEFAEDRAERAHARLRKSDEERTTVSRQLIEQRENGDKLRQERSDRIGAQRKLKELQRAFELLQLDHIKLEGRLREMAIVLAKNESNSATVWDLDAIRAMPADELLGLDPANFSGEALAISRRRFANALHPDRVRGLPLWVEKLFAELMKLVNEASDYKKKEK